MLAAQQDGKALKVKLEPHHRRKATFITVEDVSRKESVSIVKLAFSGESLA